MRPHTSAQAMHLPTERYLDQVSRWPAQGKHILAHHDAETIVVYQAYPPSIGEHAIKRRIRRRLLLRSDELDQAEFPLDDVSLRLGHQGGPGDDARSAASP